MFTGHVLGLQNMLAWKKLEESVSLAKLSRPRSERELERLAENLSPPPRNVGGPVHNVLLAAGHPQTVP